MITIWKFSLPLVPDFDLELPAGAVVLSVREQDNRPCMWAKVDTQAKLTTRSFSLVGTGHSVPAESKYLGTAHLDEGHLVVHLFEIGAS